MRRFFSIVAAAGLCALAGMPAAAEGFKDRVHADSFGNLVIHSPGGYKRIIVGEGRAAEAYNLTGSYYEPEGPQVVYLQEERAARELRRCYRPPYRWQGRSYMYGLPENVMPQAPLVCE